MKYTLNLLFTLLIAFSVCAQNHISSAQEAKKLGTISTKYNSTQKQANHQYSYNSQLYNQHANQDSVVCESVNYKRKHCYADTRGGVRLERQLSKSSCDYNWGYDYQGIWVINGCRAEFSIDRYEEYFGQNSNDIVRCESIDYRQKYCEMNLRNARAYIIHQLSHASCMNNWGYDRRGIWVKDGCRADFTIEQYDYPVNYDQETVKCESRNYQQQFCPADTYGGVELYQQLSKSTCNGNWGYDERGIWVSNGCRGKFKLTGGYDIYNNNPYGHNPYGYNQGSVYTKPKPPSRPVGPQPIDQPVGTKSTVTCESLRHTRSYCRVNTTGGISLQTQLSKSSCHGNWGYDRNGIWVDNGCRAIFEVGTPRSRNRGSGLPDIASQPIGPENYEIVRCESYNYKRNTCRTGRYQRIELHKRLSRRKCNAHWGETPRGIWVDGGCRADFKVYR